MTPEQRAAFEAEHGLYVGARIEVRWKIPRAQCAWYGARVASFADGGGRPFLEYDDGDRAELLPDEEWRWLPTLLCLE